MKRQFGSNCCNQAISLPILKQAALPDYKPNGDIPTVMCSPHASGSHASVIDSDTALPTPKPPHPMVEKVNWIGQRGQSNEVVAGHGDGQAASRQ